MWMNPATGAVEAIPRHTEIPNVLANKICRNLGLPELIPLSNVPLQPRRVMVTCAAVGAMARASRSNRSVNRDTATLTATSRCNRRSRARYTSPIPPRPIDSMIS